MILVMNFGLYVETQKLILFAFFFFFSSAILLHIL